MYYAAVWGHAVFPDSDKELAILECKRYSSGEYQDTEVWLMHDKRVARKYYNGHLIETLED